MKTRKPITGTWYAYQEIASGLWWAEGDTPGYRPEYRAKTARGAMLTPLRLNVNEREVRVVGYRCRPLSTKTKRSPKRTR